MRRYTYYIMSESDTDSYYSESDSNSDYSDTDSDKTKYTIVLCELYNSKIHGATQVTSEVHGHYMVISKFSNVSDPDLAQTATFYNRSYKKKINGISPHETIRNYKSIVTRDAYVKPEIGQCLYLDSGEYVCILKTHWLRLIQRNWKRVYLKRQEMIKKCANPKAILERQVSGKRMASLPSLQGMLYLR